MAQFDLFLPPQKPRNTGRIIGPKPPFKPRHIWGYDSSSKRMGESAISPCLIAPCGTHSLRRTKVALIYKKTGNLRACQLLLGHRKLESTVRYLASRSMTRWRCLSKSTSSVSAQQL